MNIQRVIVAEIENIYQKFGWNKKEDLKPNFYRASQVSALNQCLYNSSEIVLEKTTQNE